MNTYAGVPSDIKGRLKEAASKALENEIRDAIEILTRGRGHEFEAVVGILKALIGESEAA
jgi:hypothetical protein